MLDTTPEIVQWLKSDAAKSVMHDWVTNFPRAKIISQTDLMTDALYALACYIEDSYAGRRGCK